MSILGIFNPGIHNTHVYNDFYGKENPLRLERHKTGILTDYVWEGAEKCFDRLSSAGWFNRKVTLRLTCALFAMACVITRVVDGVIGIVAAALSLVTVGRSIHLHNVAIRGLQAPGVIEDLCRLLFIAVHSSR